MNIAFRVDASAVIGTGHFMRCLSLADELAKHGAKIRFVCRKLPEELRILLQVRHYGYSHLHEVHGIIQHDELRHAQWLEASQEQDAQGTMQVLRDMAWDWLIVDHYALDMRWEAMLRETARQILVIDDIADRQHECDILLDQNFHIDMEKRYIGKVPAQCQLLLGPRYALLRDEFRRMREHVKPRTGIVKRILVFFGGMDTDNFTGRAIEALSGVDMSGQHVDVVIGAQHPCREKIKAACALYGFICHVQTDKMAELMAAADLAVGAGGSASWERCCLGLPSLLVALADNQINIAKSLDKFGACSFLGTLETTSAKVIKNAIVALLSAPDLLKRISLKSYSLVDGLGVYRVCQRLGS